VEILQLLVEIILYNTSTNRGSNLALFDKISKSGDGGGSGDISCNYEDAELILHRRKDLTSLSDCKLILKSIFVIL
jgi:hypothetical protein